MEIQLDSPLTLFYPALLASAQGEVPSEIMEAIQAAGPYAAETWKELRPFILSPGAWLLENNWVLAILLSLLVWTVAGRLAWAFIKKFIVTPSEKWASEGRGKEFIDATKGNYDRFIAWCEAELKGPVGERMLKLGGGMLALPVAIFFASSGFDEGATESGCLEVLLSYGFRAVAAIVGLGVLVWVFMEVGRDAYKSISSMRQPGASVEYPYSIRVIFLGLGAGIVGLTVWNIGQAIVGSGNAHLKDMEVLVGVTITAVGVVISFLCLWPLLFSVMTLAGPSLHAAAVLVMWPVVTPLEKCLSKSLPSDERESPQ